MQRIWGWIKQHKEISALFAVPLLMSLIFAVALILPGLFVNPKYDFVYTICDYYCSEKPYKISDGQIYVNSTTGGNDYGRFEVDSLSETFGGDDFPIYYYDVSEKTAAEIEFSAASELQLTSSPTSPDGFVVERAGYSGGFFPLFFGGYDYDDPGWQMVKGTLKTDLDLDKQAVGSVSGYSSELEFIGWVINGQE